MKTKKKSFAKFITFCVLALFLITNAILLASCNNGNSPNDNTNEEQNNNAPTDYCEICDGVQDKKHQHDYCLEDDCDGSTHMGADHPTTQDNCDYCGDELSDNTCVDGSECYAGGKVITIGDNYKIFDAMNEDYFNNYNEQTKIDSLNLYKTRYEKYVNELINSFSKDFKTKYNITDINFRKFVSGLNNNNEVDPKYAIFDNEIEQINDVCAPVFEEIIKNIKISNYEGISHSNPSFGTEKANERHDKTRFLNLYEAMKNEAYKRGYSTNFESSTGSDTQGKDFYENTKASVTKGWNNAYKNYSLTAPFHIYITENGTEILNPAAVNEFNTMLLNAAEKAGIPLEDAQKIVNLSFVMDPLDAIHDYTSTITQHENNQCPTNEMSDTMNNIDVSLISKAQPKLNKLNFSHDYGRELV